MPLKSSFVGLISKMPLGLWPRMTLSSRSSSSCGPKIRVPFSVFCKLTHGVHSVAAASCCEPAGGCEEDEDEQLLTPAATSIVTIAVTAEARCPNMFTSNEEPPHSAHRAQCDQSARASR